MSTFLGTDRPSATIGGGGSARNLSVTVGSGDALDVQRFDVTERMSALFEVNIVAVCDNPDIDFEAVIGQPMTFTVNGAGGRTWIGICSHLQQTGVEERGLSTYQLSLVPTLWLLGQRRNHRMFQQMSEIDIVKKVLGEWGISPTLKLAGTHKKRKYRVQYGESDEAFLRRMLEDAGVSFYFDVEDGESRLILDDSPHRNIARAPIAFRDQPTVADLSHITAVRIDRRLRPGKYTVRDHDYRRPPDYKLLASASGPLGVESQLERYHYVPGAFLFESDKGDSSPMADARGKYRTDEGEAAALAQRRLEAERAAARTMSFETNAHDLAPGTVLSLLDHPKSELAAGKPLLVTESSFSGAAMGEWKHTCTAVSAEVHYRPELRTPKPRAVGVESATVVGPPGEEIHVDEFGRVCVHFHWDRESRMDGSSSCWIHVSQPWGGSGYGGTALPRVGQEVLVDFLGGDPDRPIIIGRVYTNLQKPPYKLPENKTQSGLKSNSTTGTGGYNELMFEDAGGRELLRMQAERDLNALVKNDETSTIGNDSIKSIARDNRQSVGQDRALNVGRDEAIDVGQDRIVSIGRDTKIDVGQDRILSIGRDEMLSVERDATVTIEQDQSITVGRDLTKDVAENEREMTGQNRTVNVGQSRTTDIGMVDSLTAGDKVFVAVKSSSSTMTDKKIVFTTGAGATITMEGAKVTIEADAIELFAKRSIVGKATDVVIHGNRDITLASDQTLHAATWGGLISIQAQGGDVKIGSDQSISAIATANFLADATTSTVNAAAVAVLNAGDVVTVTAKSAVLQGSIEASVGGGNVIVAGADNAAVTAGGGQVLIQGPVVNINP